MPATERGGEGVALAVAVREAHARGAATLMINAERDSRRSAARAGMGDSAARRDQAADERVLNRVAAGERSALAALYHLHAAGVFSYLVTLCADRGLAEEALQDTFVAAWRGARSFRGRSSVRTWLLGIARRQAWGRLRRRAEEPLDPEELLAAPAGDPTPEECALADAELERLAAAVGRLGPLQREIVVLAFVQQLSYAEMAELLAVPLGTVRSRLAGARRQLATLLREQEDHQ